MVKVHFVALRTVTNSILPEFTILLLKLLKRLKSSAVPVGVATSGWYRFMGKTAHYFRAKMKDAVISLYQFPCQRRTLIILSMTLC
jgi:hypothetical protein